VSPNNEVVLGDVVIAPAPSKQLVFSIRGNKITGLQTNLRAGEIVTRGQQDQPRIAYDVFNDLGALVVSGWVAHPLHGRQELFAETGTSKQVASQALDGEAIFFIKVPNLPKGGKVVFYEVPASVDLTTNKGRGQRQKLQEFPY
jgi:hypothetical protein